MLHACLDALARLDVEKALTIIHDDDELDQEFQAALRRLITYMMEDSRTIGHAINVLFIIKALERIGDHCKNIAEYIVLSGRGQRCAPCQHGRDRAGRNGKIIRFFLAARVIQLSPAPLFLFTQFCFEEPEVLKRPATDDNINYTLLSD
jgi:hypothetical protein